MSIQNKFFEDSSSEIIALSAFQKLLSSILDNESELKNLIISDEDQIWEAINLRKSILKLAIDKFCSQLRPFLGTAASSASDELTYIGVSLADDRIIKLDWKFSNMWADSPLEYDVFGSRNAGQEIFTRIDKVLGENAGSKLMNVLYFWLLCSGFSGKYATSQGSSKILSFKKSLLASGVKQRMEGAFSRKLMEPFSETSSDFREKKFLATSRPYYHSMIVSGIAFSILSLFIWQYNTSELRSLIDSSINFGIE
jgi:type VI secretion system protein ImpK